MSNARVLICALLMQPGLCLRLSRSPSASASAASAARKILDNELKPLPLVTAYPKEAITRDMPGGDAPLKPETLKKLSNHNLILIGDSNDRQAQLYKLGALGTSYSFSTIGEGEDQISTRGGGQQVFVTEAPEYNITAITLFFDGAMSVPPQPKWYRMRMDEDPKRKEWLWKFKNGELVPYEDMVNTYWPQAIKTHLKRDNPTVLLTQSSLWEGLVSFEFLKKQSRPVQFPQSGLERDFHWGNEVGLKAWNWSERVQTHLKMIHASMQKSGVHVDQIIWRTNPNCYCSPESAEWEESVIEEQAKEIRILAEGKEGISPGVTVMDWRKSFDAQKNNACGNTQELHRRGPLKDRMDARQHYNLEGYSNFWDLFAATMNADSCEAFATSSTHKLGKSTQGNTGGSWSACTHLKNYGINSSPGFNRFLSHQIAPKTALEFGCGLGTTMDFLRRRAGTDVTCIEPEETAGLVMENLKEPNRGKMQQLAINVFDEDEVTSRCAEQTFAKQYDLVYSLEVAEHIPVKYHQKLVQLLVRSAGKFLVFSAARPGQAGTGHLNESSFTTEQWTETFEKAGMVHMPKLTRMGRDSSYFSRSYDFFGNVLVFRNPLYEVADTEMPVTELLNYEFGGRPSGAVPATLTGKWHSHGLDTEVAKEEAAMWPEIIDKVHKIRSAEIKCENSGLRQADKSLVELQTGSRAEHETGTPAFGSAWSAQFFSHKI